LYEALRDGLDVRVSTPADEVNALVDPVLIRQALVNLLDNAADAVGGAGSITISVRLDGDDAVIEVEDSGSGLPSEDMDTLIQPFYSTKGRGSGMGLALVHRIVAEHGGLLEFENRQPTGALVRITLPHGLTDDRAASAQ
jgi:two-component system nitrogen regulation sensor histidine kinase NtrY